MFKEMFNAVFQLQSRQFFMQRYVLLAVFYVWCVLSSVFAMMGTSEFVGEIVSLLLVMFVTSFAPLANAIVNDRLATFNMSGVTRMSWRLLKKQFNILMHNVTTDSSDDGRKFDVNQDNWKTVLLQFVIFAGMLIIFFAWLSLIVSFYLFVGWLIVAVYESVRLLQAQTMQQNI